MFLNDEVLYINPGNSFTFKIIIINVRNIKVNYFKFVVIYRRVRRKKEEGKIHLFQ